MDNLWIVLPVNNDLHGLVTEWHATTTALTGLHWRSTGDGFEARCGPNDLLRALAAFQAFAEG